MADIDERSIDPQVRSIITAASNGLEEVVKKRLRPTESKIFDGKNDFFLVLSSDFNCMVRVAPNHSKFQLAINYGLFHFYREMTHMLFSRISVMSESQHRAGHKTNVEVPFDVTVGVAKQLMQAFWSGKIDKFHDLPLEQATKNLFHVFLTSGLRFALAHEFGHVMLEISDEGRKYKTEGEKVVSDFLSQVPNQNMPAAVHNQMIRDWGTEFASDVLGLELAMQTEDGPYKWLQMYAAEWFFTMCDMLWKYYSKMHGSIKLSTHPPPVMRLDILRNHTNAATRRIDLTEALKPMINDILKAV